MALDVGVYSGSNSKDPLKRDLVVGLEDGDLAFLHEVFIDIKNKTGVEIVPWDDARLEGAQLNLLDEHLKECVTEVQGRSDHWDEYIGFQVKPRKKLYSRLSKSELLEKLSNLRILIKNASEQNTALFFFGD